MGECTYPGTHARRVASGEPVRLALTAGEGRFVSRRGDCAQMRSLVALGEPVQETSVVDRLGEAVTKRLGSATAASLLSRAQQASTGEGWNKGEGRKGLRAIGFPL